MSDWSQWRAWNQPPESSNYFPNADPASWLTGIPNYKKVRYRNIYTGIDLVFYGNPQELEFDYIVAPHVDPGAIRIAYDGAKSMSLDSNGNLVIHSAGRELVQHRPRAYQIVAGRRIDIDARYRLSGRHVAFALAIQPK